MNRIRSIFVVAILAFSSSTFALGGEIQDPGRNDPPPPPPPQTSAIAGSEDGMALLQDLATEVFSQVMLTIF